MKGKNGVLCFYKHHTRTNMNNQIQKIIDLKKENDIFIIAHHYAPAETHEVADATAQKVSGLITKMYKAFGQI